MAADWIKSFVVRCDIRKAIIICTVACGAGMWLVQEPYAFMEETLYTSLNETSPADFMNPNVMGSKLLQGIHRRPKSLRACEITWVTAVYASECKQSHCGHWMERLSEQTECFVLFTDFNRSSINTNVIILPIISELFRGNVGYDSYLGSAPKDAYKSRWISNLKAWFLGAAADFDPFKSSYFFWLNMDEFRVPFQVKVFLPALTTSSMHWINTHPFTSSELVISSPNWVRRNCKRRFLSSEFVCEEKISSTFFGGSKEAARNWNEAYYQILERFITQGWFFGSFENLMALTCVENPQLCSLTIPKCENIHANSCLLDSFSSGSQSFHVNSVRNELEKWVAVEIGGQLGNQMFMIASSYGIAQKRKAKWCISNFQELESSMSAQSLVWKTKPVPCPGFSWKIFNITGDSTFFVLSSVFHAANEGVGFATYTPNIPNSPDENIFVGLFLQSYKYFQETGAPFLLKNHQQSREWVTQNNVTVGIHVRRGDKVRDTGNVVPPLRYYQLAVEKMRQMHGSDLVFVVCTDDMQWVKEQEFFHQFTLLSSQSPAHDMGVIASCPHRILSVGTFGWWAGYLSDNPTGTNIYPTTQFEYPLARGFSHRDYFPPHWIPLDYDENPGGVGAAS